VFYNFEWLCRNDRDRFNTAEYQVFDRCYRELKSAGPIPMILTAAYEAMKLQLTAEAQQSR
jgi:hypothetical protein